MSIWSSCRRRDFHRWCRLGLRCHANAFGGDCSVGKWLPSSHSCIGMSTASRCEVDMTSVRSPDSNVDQKHVPDNCAQSRRERFFIQQCVAAMRRPQTFVLHVGCLRLTRIQINSSVPDEVGTCTSVDVRPRGTGQNLIPPLQCSK